MFLKNILWKTLLVDILSLLTSKIPKPLGKNRSKGEIAGLSVRNRGHVRSGSRRVEARWQGCEQEARDLNSVPGWIILKAQIIKKIQMLMLLEGCILSQFVR